MSYDDPLTGGMSENEAQQGQAVDTFAPLGKQAAQEPPAGFQPQTAPSPASPLGGEGFASAGYVPPQPQSPFEAAPPSYEAYQTGYQYQQPGAAAQPQVPYGQAAYPPPAVPYIMPAAPQPGDGKATGALICGILGLVLCFVPLVGGILAVIAIVLAVLAKRAGTSKGTSTGGLVLGIIGTLLGVLFTIITLWAVFVISDELGAGGYDIDQIAEELGTEWDEGAGSGDQALSGNFADPDDQAAYDSAVEVLDVVRDPDDDAVQNLARAIDESFQGTSGMSLSDVGVDPVELVQWITADATYDITDVYTFEDGTGTVYYTAHVRDLEELMDRVGEKVDEYMDSNDFQNASKEEKSQRFGEIMHEALGEPAEMEDRSGWLDMQEFDGKWAPTRDSLDSLANDFYGTYWG